MFNLCIPNPPSGQRHTHNIQNTGMNTDIITDSWGNAQMFSAVTAESTLSIINKTETKEDKGNVAAEARQYLPFQVGLAIRLYYVPIMVITGLVGNTLSFLG